jgi:uncharacterized membrane protein YraQ (UPF0718 family)
MIYKLAEILSGALVYIMQSLLHNGIYLFLSIAVAVAMTVYVNAEKLRRFFYRKPGLLIPGSVATGALTPLCACGTMAVVFALVGSALPWGPIMAFLVSSPLMSPDTFVLLSGFMGVKFAIALTIASLILGLGAGYLTWIIERKTSFFDHQLLKQKGSCTCQAETDQVIHVPVKLAVCCSEGRFTGIKTWQMEVQPARGRELSVLLAKLKPKEFITQFYKLGIRKILPLYAIFILIAYLIKTYVPTAWIITLFSGEHFYSVPLASVIGLPLYISDATVVPLLQVFKDAGASNGALMAFMISGPGTSLGVIGGLMILMKKRAIGLYLAFIFFGAILLGYLTDLLPFAL